MQNLRIIAVLLVLSLVAFCLVSTPVLSGEHPWDADDGGSGGDETEADTIVSVDDAGGTCGQQEGGGPSWWNELVAWFCQTAFNLVYQIDHSSMQYPTGKMGTKAQESDGGVAIN